MLFGTFGVGWLPLSQVTIFDTSFLNYFRTDFTGEIIAGAALSLGVVGLVFAWLQLGVRVTAGAVTDLRRLWATLAIWCAPLIFAPAVFSRDVYSYLAQGQMLNEGLNPYLSGPSAQLGWYSHGVDPLWANNPTPYGQFFLTMAQVTSHLIGGNLYLGVIIMRLLAIVGVALLAWAVADIAKSMGVEAPFAVWLAVLNPLVFMHFIAGAHNDALMIGLIAVGIALALRHQFIWGIVLITLAGSVKPIGLIALPFLGLLWAGKYSTYGRLARCWAITAAVSLGILWLLALATGTGFEWANAIGTPSEVRTWLSPTTALGMLVGSAIDLFGFNVIDATVSIFRFIGAAIGLVIIARMILNPRGKDPIRQLGWTFLIVVLLGPVTQPWYLLWSVALLAASGTSKIENRVIVLGSIVLIAVGLISNFFDGVSYY